MIHRLFAQQTIQTFHFIGGVNKCKNSEFECQSLKTGMIWFRFNAVALAPLTALQSSRDKASKNLILETFPWNLIPSLRGPPPTEVGSQCFICSRRPLLCQKPSRPYCVTSFLQAWTLTKVCFVLSLSESDPVPSFHRINGSKWRGAVIWW